MSDCIIFNGCKDKKGYGLISKNKKHYRAHRLAYAEYIGVDIIEVKGNVLHSCDNPSCVNPLHLREGTNYENVQDRVSRGRNGSTPGERHAMSKLTDKEVIQIRNYYIPPGKIKDLRYGNGKEICEKYGISATQLMNIVRRIKWKHI